MEPYYQDAHCTIYHGDCREVLPHLAPGVEIDLMLADPPYNVGFGYNQYDDNMTGAAYSEWSASWFLLASSIAKRSCVFPGHGNLPMWLDIKRPSGIACWYKPGNPAKGGIFQFCEWEPVLFYGKAMGGSDVFRQTITAQPDTGDHPCPKPLPLIKQIIARSKAAVVLDPFLGSGTTTAAAKGLGVKAIGIEIDERYCEIAAKRLGQEVLFA